MSASDLRRKSGAADDALQKIQEEARNSGPDQRTMVMIRMPVSL